VLKRFINSKFFISCINDLPKNLLYKINLYVQAVHKILKYFKLTSKLYIDGLTNIYWF